MTKISSRFTFFYKKVFPVLWFGFLAFFVVATVLTGTATQNPVFLFIPVFMAIMGFFLLQKLVWDLADEVYDCGESLLVKNGGKEDRVALSNIMNVSASTYVNPPRVALTLAAPGRFGKEIVFTPVTGIIVNPFAKNKVIEGLIARVDQARSNRRT